MNRWIKRITLTLLIAIVVAAVGLWLGYIVVLPHLIRSEVNAAFARAGLSNVRFDLTAATLWAADLRNLSAAGETPLTIGAVAVRYSPMDALRGRIDSILITDGRLVLDLDNLPHEAPARSGAGAGKPVDLPFGRLDLQECLLVLKHAGRESEFPVSGSILSVADGTAQLSLDSSLAGSPLEIRGSIDPGAASGSITARADAVKAAALLDVVPAGVAAVIDVAGGIVDIALDFHREGGTSRAALELALHDVMLASDPELDLNLCGVNGTITLDDLLTPATPAEQTLAISRVTVAGQELRNATIAFHLADADRLEVRRLGFAWAGGTVHAEPFVVTPSEPGFATTVTAERVGLRQAVALLTGGRATGDGTVSGSVPIEAHWITTASGRQTLHTDVGEGSLQADQPGNLRLGDASEDFGQLLEQSDPRFANDPIFVQMKEDVVAAARDFNFHLLQVRFFEDEAGDLVTLIRLHGRGRTGSRLPVNLNLTVTGADEALNAYLATKSRVFSKARLK